MVPCRCIFSPWLCHLCSRVQWFQMMWLQAITLVKSRSYSSTLKAAGCSPSVLSRGLESAALPLKPSDVWFFLSALGSIHFQQCVCWCVCQMSSEEKGRDWWWALMSHALIWVASSASNSLPASGLRRHPSSTPPVSEKGCNAHFLANIQGGK